MTNCRYLLHRKLYHCFGRRKAGRYLFRHKPCDRLYRPVGIVTQTRRRSVGMKSVRCPVSRQQRRYAIA
nr:hypothetical protein [Argonema galeatum]